MAEEKGINIPPQNLEAEQAVLGALLLEKDAVIKVADVLISEDFYHPGHALIYAAVLKLFEKRMPVDLVTLTNVLEKDKQLKDVGGASYLASLTSAAPSTANIVSWAEIIRSKSTLRRLIAAASQIMSLGYEEKEDITEILDQAESSLFAVSQRFLREFFVPIKEILKDSFERIDELHKHKGKLRGVPTGFRELDNLLAGLQTSDLIILASRPSMGKSSLAITIASFAAIEHKVPVGIFSLEMSKDQLVDRLVAPLAAVDAWKLRTGNLDEDDFSKIGYAYGVLSEAPLFIDDSPMLNITELRTKARRLQMEHGLGLLVVDYLQLMEGKRRSADFNRVQEISEISRNLKAVARELNVPVLALSQLSRAVEMRTPKIPQLSDLRESGCLTGDTQIMHAKTGQLFTIKELAEGKMVIPVLSMDKGLKLETKTMVKVFSSGRKKVYKLRLASGKEIKASANHPFYTIEGWKRLDELKAGEHLGVPSSYNSHMVWDKIDHFKPLGTEEVYDATVPVNYNFVANDVIVHNSIEQDSDVVMFIYREDYYEPKTERKNLADILIRKHRHGPVG
ncbi:replicative DNA helicase, partial [Candidatus Berkelbacteria bacterium]|nr:replicative DNA helicase [Candidatus Berkelbacteria bacterium]